MMVSERSLIVIQSMVLSHEEERRERPQERHENSEGAGARMSAVRGRS